MRTTLKIYKGFVFWTIEDRKDKFWFIEKIRR